MAHKKYDGVQQLATGTGAGALTLGAATQAYYRTMQAAGVSNGDTLTCRIQHETLPAEWEEVLVTYSAGTITRTYDTNASSATGSLISFGAGNKIVSNVIRAGDAVVLDNNGDAAVTANMSAANFVVGTMATGLAGTVGFTNSNGPAVQFFGTASVGVGSLELVTGGTNRWVLQAAGHLVPKAADTYKIGAPSAPVLDIWSQNYRIGAEAATNAGTVGFTNSNGPAIQFFGNSSAGAGSLVGQVAGASISSLLATGFFVGAGLNLGFTSRGALKATADGVFELVNNGVTAQGSLKVKNLIAADATVWPIDTTALAQTIADGATFTLEAGSGMVVLTETTGGQTALFICGGGAITLVSQTGAIYVAGAPGAGKIGLEFSGGVYRINNNSGGSRIIGIGGMRTRAAV